MTPGQDEVITEYVIHGDGVWKVQPYLLLVYLLLKTRGGAGKRVSALVVSNGGRSICWVGSSQSPRVGEDQ